MDPANNSILLCLYTNVVCGHSFLSTEQRCESDTLFRGWLSLTAVVGTVGSGQHMESLGFDTTLETDDAANMQTDTRKLTQARYEETNSPPSPVASEARIYMSI